MDEKQLAALTEAQGIIAAHSIVLMRLAIRVSEAADDPPAVARGMFNSIMDHWERGVPAPEDGYQTVAREWIASFFSLLEKNLRSNGEG
jgi:hypothetical protein